jgi:spore coat polysaccharide biosynthesis protein SpsF (cytidylyltransferase family)
MALKTLLITQARTGSTRLPGKVLKTIEGKTLLEIHLERLKKCKRVNNILVATTTHPNDEIIFDNSIKWGFHSFRGSEQDVLDRFYQAAKPYEPDWIVRVTSDCPLIDPALIDAVIEFAQNKNADYCANNLRDFPDGQDVEVFKFTVLEKAWKEATEKSDREHVTTFIRNNRNSLFSLAEYTGQGNFSEVRMTVDDAKDFELIEHLIHELGTDKTWKEYAEHIINRARHDK